MGGSRSRVWFVVLATSRTGSTMISTLLNTHTRILSFSEECHHKYNDELQRAPNGETYLRGRVYESELLRPKHLAVGFKLCTHQARKPPMTDVREFLQREGVRVILTRRRNLLKQIVSAAVATKTKQWWATDENRLAPPVRVRLDTRTLPDDLEELRKRVQRDADEFRSHPKLVSYYEDWLEDAQSEQIRLQEFLSVPIHRNLRPLTIRQNRRSLAETVENYEEVVQTLHGTKWERFLVAPTKPVRGH